MILGIIIGLFIVVCVGIVVMAIIRMAKDDDGKTALRFSDKILLQKSYYKWLDEESRIYKNDFPDSTADIEDNAFNVFCFLEVGGFLDTAEIKRFVDSKIREETEHDDQTVK